MSPFIWFTIKVYEQLKAELSPQVLEMMSDETLCHIAWLAVQDFPRKEIYKKVFAPETIVNRAVDLAQEKWVERKLALKEVEHFSLSDYRYMVD